MGSKLLTVVTTSYNKGQLLPELKLALAGQVMSKSQWNWWIMDNSTDDHTRALVDSWDEDWIKVTHHDFTPEERSARFAHPVLMNQAIQELDTELFLHISDDDLPEPSFLQTLSTFLTYNREKSASYCPIRQVRRPGGDEVLVNIEKIPPAPVVFSESVSPLGNLDGNSVMFRVSALRALATALSGFGWTLWPENWSRSNICDGQMLSYFCLVLQEKIWPATSDALLNHQITPLSTFNNAILGVRHNPGKDPLCSDIFGSLLGDAKNDT